MPYRTDDDVITNPSRHWPKDLPTFLADSDVKIIKPDGTIEWQKPVLYWDIPRSQKRGKLSVKGVSHA